MSFGKGSYAVDYKLYWKNNDAKFIVGNFTSIGINAKIYLGDGTHTTKWVTTYPFGHTHQRIY